MDASLHSESIYKDGFWSRRARAASLERVRLLQTGIQGVHAGPGVPTSLAHSAADIHLHSSADR